MAGLQHELLRRHRTDSAPGLEEVPKQRRVSGLRRSASADARLHRDDIERIGRISPIHPHFGFLSALRQVVQLYARLQRLLGLPAMWLWQFVRLVAFVVLMLPGLIPPFLKFLTSKRIQKNIVYGSESWRQQLDIYLPDTALEKAPVVIFISGGAWIIGYKMWGWIMGQVFQKQGVLFIAPDYRNFPEATVPTMVHDVALAIDWVLSNLEALGGDPDNVTLMGQSAGAHLSAMVIVEQSDQEAAWIASSASSPSETDNLVEPGWSLASVARFVGISGPYDIVQVMPTMRERGLPRRVIRMLMDHDLNRFSPTQRVRDLTVADPLQALSLFPPVHLFNGTADKTVDWRQAEGFADALRRGGAEVTTKYYQDKSHTDPILEGPCGGEVDELMIDLLELLKPGERNDGSFAFGSLQPRLLLSLAKFCNPF